MSEMKNVLLLGDSRRQGYEPYVRTILEGRAGVYGPNENGRWAGYTLNSLRFWLDQFPVPQIVHWNCGLWDLGDDYHIGRPFSLPEEYESAVDRTVIVLQKLFPGCQIIMATIMPTSATSRADTPALMRWCRRWRRRRRPPPAAVRYRGCSSRH